MSRGASAGGEELLVPLDGATEGRLRFTVGAENCELLADETVDGLCRVHFGNPRPEVMVTGSTVHVRFPRLRGWSRKSRPTVLRLGASIPWTIEVDGGAQGLTVDLRHGVLASFVLHGGAGGLDLRLPAPRGTTPVRLGKGASRLRLRRPRGVPVRCHVRGGVSDGRFDDHHFGGVSGPMDWQSPDYDAATDRYDIEIDGGASHPSVEAEG